MLFNSYEFIFVFLPVVLAVFLLLGKNNLREPAFVWLVSASLFFYGWWNALYLALILLSIAANYLIGKAIMNSHDQGRKGIARACLVMGVTGNILLLGYYKYYNFFVENINAMTGLGIAQDTIILPLAISFFTFQQIAYLVDTYRDECREYSFIHYALFVTFFPQLIAGPIVHHKEMMPQFASRMFSRFRSRNFAVGFTIFVIGLFKKVVIADGVALYASPVFSSASQGDLIGFSDAWLGSLAYTFQLYFDFSGYCDMAIGLAYMFGIRLPMNFDSPYKSKSIIEFWRRWHITLSRFLRDYVYIPLGGNRKGSARRYLNLMATMLLGGLWHGAGWTFVIWGGLHGLYLVVNHGWHALLKTTGFVGLRENRVWVVVAHAMTFVAIVVGWVFFRADDLAGAANILAGMFGLHGFEVPKNGGFGYILLCMIIVWGLPNTQEWLAKYRPVIMPARRHQEPVWLLGQWRPSVWMACAMAVMFIVSVLYLTRASEFLYFRF